jgi:hypothetical protein
MYYMFHIKIEKELVTTLEQPQAIHETHITNMNSHLSLLSHDHRSLLRHELSRASKGRRTTNQHKDIDHHRSNLQPPRPIQRPPR